MKLFILITLLAISTNAAIADGLSGYGELKGLAYSERTTSRDPWVSGWGTLFAKWEQRLEETQLTASVRGEWITSHERGPLTFDPADRDLRRSPISVRDLWLRYPLSPAIDLQAGRFQLGWGKTDGYSPADAFLPRDLTDPFADEKLPLWSVRLTGQEGNIRYELVGTPITTPWRLPELGSRNAPLNVDVPQGIILHELDSAPPVTGFAAARILATWGDWDVGGWLRGGNRPAPILEFHPDQATVTATGITLPVSRCYAEEEGIGIEVSRVVGAWILRGEVAGLFSRDKDLGNAAIGALSAEKGFGDGTLLITLAANAIDPPVDETLLFDRAVLPALITAWNRNEEWGEWKVVWSVGLKRGDGLVKGEVGYNLTDVWKVTTGVEAPYGDHNGAFGTLESARRLHLAIRRSW